MKFGKLLIILIQYYYGTDKFVNRKNERWG